VKVTLRRALVVVVACAAAAALVAWASAQRRAPAMVWIRVAPTEIADVEIRQAPNGRRLGVGRYVPGADGGVWVRTLRGFARNDLERLVGRLGVARPTGALATYRPTDVVEGRWTRFELAEER
jgi:hypothetical protein